MIRLHPIPETNHTCPHCQVSLEASGWYIPGMRNLAELKCKRCEREYYGDLPASHGIYYPMLLDRATGDVHDNVGVDWFSAWLRDSSASRLDLPVEFVVEDFRPLKQPVLLNCLDTLYGHCLLKLLNSQYYLDHRPDLDLIVLVPHFLRWLVPEGAAAIWTVDLPLQRGIEWNDWLAREVKRRIEPLEECWLSVAHSHPHPKDYNIERFSMVQPFPLEEWLTRMDRPTVTFIWREDRVWPDLNRHGWWQRLKQVHRHRTISTQDFLDEQTKSVVALAHALRQVFPQIDFGIVGLGQAGGFPSSVEDLRSQDINEGIERAWCRRYAQSHVVIGVHGSNMLLPSAHAGAVVELVPPDRWPNLGQDILVVAHDAREVMWRYRFLPLDTQVSVVADVTASLFRYTPIAMQNFKLTCCGREVLQSDRSFIVKRRREMLQRATSDKVAI